MKILKLNEELIDTLKVSYIGVIDSHIKHDVKASNTTFFFPIIIDGHKVEIKNSSKQELNVLRNILIGSLSEVDSFLPG